MIVIIIQTFSFLVVATQSSTLQQVAKVGMLILIIDIYLCYL